MKLVHWSVIAMVYSWFMFVLYLLNGEKSFTMKDRYHGIGPLLNRPLVLRAHGPIKKRPLA